MNSNPAMLPEQSIQPLNGKQPPELQQPAARHHVILLTSGPEDGGKRATLAFSAACSAAAMDLTPHVFLIGDGSYWAYEGHTENVHTPGFPALEDLVTDYLELEGKLYICAACDQVCSTPEADGTLPHRRTGVELRGLASVLQYTVNGCSMTF